MLLWMATAVAAYFVKGLCGFANTLVLTSVLAFRESNAVITPVDLLLGCPANALMAWRYRREADWRVWLPMALLMFAGIIPGAFFLKNLDSRTVKLIFGFVIILTGAEMLLRERRTKPGKDPRLLRYVIGVLSGVLCGLYGVGTLLAAYFSRTTADDRAYKGSMSVVFLLDNIFRIVLYAVTGVFTAGMLKRAALLLPCMGLGLFLGMKSAGRLNEKTVKRIVILMLIVSGVMLVITNIRR